jgi:hypothetical protein
MGFKAVKDLKPSRISGTGKHRFTMEDYQVLVGAYRKHQELHTKAAAIAHCDVRTARKAWNVGLRYDWAQKPIRVLLEEERVLARANLYSEAPREAAAVQEVSAAAHGGSVRIARRAAENAVLPEVPPDPNYTAPIPRTTAEAARADAAATLTAEVKLVRGARGNALALVSMTGMLIRGLGGIVSKLKGMLERLLDDCEVNGTIDIDRVFDVVKLIKEIVGLHQKNSYAADRILVMERRLLGGGDDVDDLADEMTVEEAMSEIKAATEVVERLQPQLRVIEGGKGTGIP